MSDTLQRDSDSILAARYGVTEETIRARIALNDGCAAFDAGNLAEAESCFREAKRLAVGCITTLTTARRYLASTYFTRYWPGQFKDVNEAAANAKWLGMAEREYREILASGADERDREYAEAGLRYLGPSQC